MSDNVRVIRYRVHCETCGWVSYRTAHIDEDLPDGCPRNVGHTITSIEPEIVFSTLRMNPQKGIQHMVQYQNLHKDRNGVCNYRPIIVAPPSGFTFEITEVQVVWHEALTMPSKVVWEVRLDNPMFDPEEEVSLSNLPFLVVSQFFYKDLSAMWSGSHRRPISDGPTREMVHRFSDRNSHSNVESFILDSTNGLRIYTYGTEDSEHAPGEGTQYITVGGNIFYIPYTELAIDGNGLYNSTKAAYYDVNLLGQEYIDKIYQTDDCFTFNVIGSLFRVSEPE